MSTLLLIKTSSLGDVVSNLPVVSDILRAQPDARIDWVVEESFAAIARLHPGVRRVIPVALRRWRKRLLRPDTWRQIQAMRHALGAERYDAVIDTQGLIKSAWLVRQARGHKVGYDRASIREPLACRAYDQRVAVSWQWQAVARNRALAAAALGYAAAPGFDPQGIPDYGLDVPPAAATWLPPGAFAVLLTATSRAEKYWPEKNWAQLGAALHDHGLASVLPAGSAAERDTAQRIAAQIPGAVVAPPLALDALAGVLARARCVVGVDTGLTHLAAAVGRPVVGVYVGSSPEANGVIARDAINLGAPGRAPTVAAVLEALARHIA